MVHHVNAGIASSLVLPSALVVITPISHPFSISLVAKIVQMVGWINILCVFFFLPKMNALYIPLNRHIHLY